jgi:transposase-like protein
LTFHSWSPTEDAALEALERGTEKWEDDYTNALKNWDVILPIFKFSAEVRKVIYTTNAIESLNSGYCCLNKQRSVFSKRYSASEGAVSGNA